MHELHEPPALPVIERVVERLGCVGDLPQVRGLRCKGVGLAPHLRDVVRLRITARVPLRAGVNVADMMKASKTTDAAVEPNKKAADASVNAVSIAHAKIAAAAVRRLKCEITALLILERAMGFEPTTPTLARLCSTPELHPHPKRGYAAKAP